MNRGTGGCGHIPLLVRRGARANQRFVRKRRAGWSLTHNVSECVLKMARARPPRLRRFDASRHSLGLRASALALRVLDGAATLPHEEGTIPAHAIDLIHSHVL